MVTIYSKYAARISSNGSHFLTDRVFCIEYIRSVNLGKDGQSERLLCTLSILNI